MPKTFQFQEQLKTLPLTNLNDAGKNFLNWVEPLVTTEQFNTTKDNLKNFMNNDGLILEKKLEEWSAQNDGNWLAPLWKDMYLDIREPVAIDVNYFVKLNTDHLKSKYTNSEIVGVIINNLFDVYESIVNETFEPEKIREIPLCMASYKEMFKATKIPKQNRDEYIVMPKTKKNHIILMYRNNMFKVNLSDEKGKRYSSKIIINTLNNLINSKLDYYDNSIGVITTANRDEAAALLEDIILINSNNENLEIVKDALFMVCMDEKSKDLNEFAMSMIGANEDNRYFDKNLQLIIDNNGNCGFNIEHTGADAGSWINIINMVYEELNNISLYKEDISEDILQIEQLNWKLSLNIKTQLKRLKTQHQEKVEDIHQEIIYFKDFGSKGIKALKYSPDAFLQLALQLAQYRTYNKLRSTYEAVATRAYLNGRTECTRPISMELIDFIKAFEKKETNTSTLKEMMSFACQKQSSRIKDCLGSNGIERYFFALKNMYTLFSDELGLKEVPQFFNDESYKQLTYSYLSTSRIESKYFDLGGFGPVVPDGYGFWYNLLENRIDMNLITRNSVNGKEIKAFRDSLEKSLIDLSKLAAE